MPLLRWQVMIGPRPPAAAHVRGCDARAPHAAALPSVGRSPSAGGYAPCLSTCIERAGVNPCAPAARVGSLAPPALAGNDGTRAC